MRRGALLVVVVIFSALSLLVSSGAVWAAGNWAVHVATVNSGEAHAQALPAVPTATSACTSPASAKTILVSWSAVTHATTYGVYQSTTSATGTYTLVTSVSTTSWTSAALAAGSYWYEVIAKVGSNWASAKSAATAQRTISSTVCS